MLVMLALVLALAVLSVAAELEVGINSSWFRSSFCFMVNDTVDSLTGSELVTMDVGVCGVVDDSFSPSC